MVTWRAIHLDLLKYNEAVDTVRLDIVIDDPLGSRLEPTISRFWSQRLFNVFFERNIPFHYRFVFVVSQRQRVQQRPHAGLASLFTAAVFVLRDMLWRKGEILPHCLRFLIIVKAFNRASMWLLYEEAGFG